MPAAVASRYARALVDVVLSPTSRTEPSRVRSDLRSFQETLAASPELAGDRDAFERKFPPELQDRLNRLIWTLPAGQRQYYRTRIMAAVATAGETEGADPSKIDLTHILERCRSEVVAAILK